MSKFKPFIDSHIHSHYSLLDGVSSPTDNVKRAAELGMPAIAISDHGTLAGIYEFYFAAKKHKIVPIIGVELYWKPDIEERDKSKKYHHAGLFAINEVGFRNLLKLASLGFQEGRYQFNRPVVSLDDILEHNEGLILSTGCMVGVMGISHGLPEEYTEKYIAILNETFKGRMFVEAGPASVCMDWDKNNKIFVPSPNGDLQVKHNKRAMKMADKFNLPIIIASDAHMAKPELKSVQDLLISGQSGGWHFYQTHAMLSSDDTWQLMQQHHPYVSETQFEGWIDNTYMLMDLARNLELKFHPMVPKFPIETHRLYKQGMNERDLMMAIIKSKGRMKNTPEYINRLKKELDVIINNGLIDYTNYFLILADVVEYAKSIDVEVGPGRGSAGGSLLAYLLGITAINPMEWGLSFERFLNEGRLGKPQISFDELPFDRWKINYDK